MSLFFKSKTGIFLNGIVLLPKNAKELFVVFFVLKCSDCLFVFFNWLVMSIFQNIHFFFPLVTANYVQIFIFSYHN